MITVHNRQKFYPLFDWPLKSELVITRLCYQVVDEIKEEALPANCMLKLRTYLSQSNIQIQDFKEMSELSDQRDGVGSKF